MVASPHQTAVSVSLSSSSDSPRPAQLVSTTVSRTVTRTAKLKIAERTISPQHLDRITEECCREALHKHGLEAALDTKPGAWMWEIQDPQLRSGLCKESVAALICTSLKQCTSRPSPWSVENRCVNSIIKTVKIPVPQRKHLDAPQTHRHASLGG